MLRINELFYSVQGEGKTIGHPRLFIRLSGCNLKCNFCDTKYHPKVNEVDETLFAKYDKWCITGGEPLLQQREIINLINEYNPSWVEIETNGTIEPELGLIKHVDLFNVSPKRKEWQPKGINTNVINLQKFKRFIVKIVYNTKDDEFFIQNFSDYKDKLYIMPEGATRKGQFNKMERVAKYCMEKGYILSPRIQTLIWNNKRGI